MNFPLKNSVQCIEGHTAGMPVKVVFFPFVNGATMQEKKEYCSASLDHIRKLLTFEPRGSSNQYGVVVTSPVTNDAHFGAIYFEPSEWLYMCGHATFFLASLAVQLGMIPRNENGPTKVLIDTPAGRVEVNVFIKANEIEKLSLVNVPSFVHSVHKLNINGIGNVEIPVIFSGDFYAIIDLDVFEQKFSKEMLPTLHATTSEILDKFSAIAIEHPLLKGVHGLYGVRYHSTMDSKLNKVYGVLFYGNQKNIALDRSPSGTGSSAHLAYLYFLKKSIRLNQDVEFHSAIDTIFKVKALREVDVGEKKAIVPEISTIDKGSYITGFSTYIEDAGDKLGSGYNPVSPF